MDSTVVIADGQMVLEGTAQPFTLRVTTGKAGAQVQNMALMEVTVYEENGSFSPQCSYLFEAVDAQGRLLARVDLNEFKTAIDAYCTRELATEYYVKSIPRASCFCNKEMQAFNF